MHKVLTLVALATFITLATSLSYERFKSYRVYPKNDADTKFLNVLQNNKNIVSWSFVSGSHVDLIVAPQVQSKFVQLLNKRKLSYDIQIENVESVIQKQEDFHKNLPKPEGGITFDRYWRHADMNQYLDDLATNYSDIVKVEVIGESWENRDLKVIHISTATNGTNPTIFLDGGIHAREWIAPAVTLYVIQQLVENPANADLIKNIDWIILPSLNPDGYEYTWDEDRFWRKNRRPGQSEECPGVDLNRNFGYHWMEGGASDEECSDVYAGYEAFSEMESQSLRDFLRRKNQNLVLYITFHSFAQVIIYPWSYTDELPEDAQELQELGDKAADAIKAVRGTEYEVGDTYEVMYAAAGASHDWAKGGAGINLSYTIELPGGGSGGFDLPPEDIEAVVTETFEGIKVFHSHVEEKFTKSAENKIR